MILLTDTFGVEQIEAACTVSIEKIEIEEVQAALAQGSFDTYFEFGELELEAQDVLGVQVPETEMRHCPTFKDGFDLIVVGYVKDDMDVFTTTFWRVVGVVRPQ